VTVLAQHLPVLLTVVPLLAAALVAAVGHWLPRPLADATALAVSAAVLAGAVWLLLAVGSGHVVDWVGGWLPSNGQSVGIAMVADRLSAGLVVVVAGLTVVALTYSWRYIEDVGSSYHTLVLAFMAAMTGFTFAGDLFDAFVWFELMGACAYALTGLRVEEPRSVEGALNFGIVNSLGASFSLLGVSFLYARTGELNLAAVGDQLRSSPVDRTVVVACVLLLSGLLVKAAVVPFHFWTADAEAVAPTPVCALLSGAMVALGVYGVARMWWVVFDGVVSTASIRTALLVLGSLTAVLGAVMCVGQRHVKRLLAYSTVSHVGVALIAVAMLDEEGVVAGALYIVGHACVKGALFLGSGVLLNRFETVDEHELFGRGRPMRLTAVVFFVGGLGLAGCPALGLWLGKTVLEHAQTASHLEWAVPVILVASVLTGGAVLRVALRVFAGVGPRPGDSDAATHDEHRETDVKISRAPISMIGPSWVLLAASVVACVVPGVHRVAAAAAATFVDRPGYVSAVLHPGIAHTPAGEGSVSPVWTLSGVGLGLIAVALAAAVAAAGVWSAQLPGWVGVALRPARPVVAALHGLHEGHVGDYVAWTVLGIAGFGVAMVL
jgi:multicomponent Na+:H+ antiporter subunit D